MEKLVFTNGCFDLLHEGHKYLLTRASKYGRLIVGLNSDGSVRRLKGPGRPIWDQRKRKQKLEELDYVSNVFIFDDDTPLNLINSFRPGMIIVKGSDYKPEEVIGCSVASEVIIVPILKGYNTTKMIEDNYGT